MGKIAHFRNLREKNSSRSPAHWIYQSINPIIKLLSASQIALNNCKPVELELFLYGRFFTAGKYLIILFFMFHNSCSIFCDLVSVTGFFNFNI